MDIISEHELAYVYTKRTVIDDPVTDPVPAMTDDKVL